MQEFAPGRNFVRGDFNSVNRQMKTKLILISMTIATTSFAQTSFNAERVEKTASFEVNASIEKAFPLFGPIREKEWAAGWEPQIIFSSNPEVEEHMIFKTSGRYHGEEEYLWVVSQFKPKEYFIEYTVSTSQRVWFISVKCRPGRKNTIVTVTYSFTGLSVEGNKLNQQALDKMYARDLKDWEEDISYYLETGKQKH